MLATVWHTRSVGRRFMRTIGRTKRLWLHLLVGDGRESRSGLGAGGGGAFPAARAEERRGPVRQANARRAAALCAWRRALVAVPAFVETADARVCFLSRCAAAVWRCTWTMTPFCRGQKFSSCSSVWERSRLSHVVSMWLLKGWCILQLSASYDRSSRTVCSELLRSSARRIQFTADALTELRDAVAECTAFT